MAETIEEWAWRRRAGPARHQSGNRSSPRAGGPPRAAPRRPCGRTRAPHPGASACPSGRPAGLHTRPPLPCEGRPRLAPVAGATSAVARARTGICSVPRRPLPTARRRAPPRATTVTRVGAKEPPGRRTSAARSGTRCGRPARTAVFLASSRYSDSERCRGSAPPARARRARTGAGRRRSSPGPPTSRRGRPLAGGGPWRRAPARRPPGGPHDRARLPLKAGAEQIGDTSMTIRAPTSCTPTSGVVGGSTQHLLRAAGEGEVPGRGRRGARPQPVAAAPRGPPCRGARARAPRGRGRPSARSP